jgi:hypothetical protein
VKKLFALYIIKVATPISINAKVIAEKYLCVGSKLEKSGGKNGSRRKKPKNPHIKINNRIKEKDVTLFNVGITVSFQSSASEQAIVARMIVELKIVPNIAKKYCSRLIVSKVKVKNVGGIWASNPQPIAAAINPNPSNRNHEN